MKNLHPSEAAAIIQVSGRTVYRRMRDGTLKFSQGRENLVVTGGQLPREIFLKPKEVAGVLRLSRSSVYRFFNEGKLEGIRLRRTIRIYKSSVLKLLENE